MSRKIHKDWEKYIVVHKNVVPQDICEEVERRTLELMEKNDRVKQGLLTDFDPDIEDDFFKTLSPLFSSIFNPYYTEYAYNMGLHYGDLKFDSLSVTLYCEGSGKDMHYDSEILTLDGKTGDHGPIGASCPMTSSDKYEGGVLNFPNQEFNYKPDAGDLILFPSNFLYPHELTEVDGDRVCVFPYYYIDIPNHSCAEDNLDIKRKEKFREY